MHMTTVKTGPFWEKLEHIFDTVKVNSQYVSHGESVTALVHITGLPPFLLYGICRGLPVNLISHKKFYISSRTETMNEKIESTGRSQCTADSPSVLCLLAKAVV